MPHFWNNILVVTETELIPNWWTNYNNLKNELWRYSKKSYGIKRAQLGGNGRQLLVSFDSLPKHIQDGIGDPRKMQNPLEAFYVTDAKAVEFYTNFERPHYGYLKPDEYERYITNASMIKALLMLEKARITERLTKGGSVRATKNVKSVDETLWRDAQTFQEILKTKHGVQHSLPTHPRKFKEKIKDFQKLEYVALIKDAKGKKLKNASKFNKATQKILNDLFGTQTTKPTATEISRQYQAFLDGYVEIISNKTGEVYNPKEYKELSVSSITNYLSAWESKIGTHAKRSGDRQVLMQKFEPYHSLKQPTFAGSIISIDDRNPPFKYEKGKRMWFYNGIDLASECFTTWVYGKTKEGIIIDFYRQMIRNYHEWGFNLPDGLECESSLNSSFKNTFLQPGAMFQNVRIEANNARGKRIEAYFSPLRYGLEKKREGWIARPFAKSEPNQPSAEPDKLIPYEVLADASVQDLITWNNMPHSKHPNMTRWEYFKNNQNPDLKPTNYKAILPHLGETTVTSCNAGIIKLQSSEWILGKEGEISTGETLIELMKRVEGKTFEIKWLDDNYGKVFIAYIYLDGQFICEAISKPIYSRAKIEITPEEKVSRELMTRYVATIQGYQRQQKNSIETVTVIDNRPLTLNNDFVVPGMRNKKTITHKEITEVEVLKDNTDEFEYNPNQNNKAGTGWESAFN